MAISIGEKTTTTTSISLYLYGLNDQWTSKDGQRTVKWYLGEKGTPTETSYFKTKSVDIKEGVDKGPYSGGDVTFTGLKSYTRYFVYCAVYCGSEFLADTDGEVWTAYDDGGSTDEEEEDTTWYVSGKAVNYVTDSYYTDYTLWPYEVLRLKVKFESYGTATFYTKGNVDTIGFITTTTGLDEIDGRPTGTILAEDDDGGDGSNFSITYNVVPDTPYYFWCRACDAEKHSIDVYIDFKETSYKVAKWSWTKSNGTATDEQTKSAEDAVENKGSTQNFSYKVWNDMVDKVKKLTDNSTGYWDTDYGSYSETKMTSSGEKLTAKKFNSLRNNLELVAKDVGVSQIPEATEPNNATSGTIYQPVSSGHRVFGHYFITLATKINECIEKL